MPNLIQSQKFQESPDGTYRKNYYLPTRFLATWIGAYSFCKANDLQLLTFETSEEQTNLLTILENEYSFYSDLLETSEFELYLGAFAFTPNSSNGFVWYSSGKKIHPGIDLKWNTGEPNDSDKLERCSSIKYNYWYSSVGINDCQCNNIGVTKGTMICQKYQALGKKKGYHKKVEK